jgi:hypothetical protein
MVTVTVTPTVLTDTSLKGAPHPQKTRLGLRGCYGLKRQGVQGGLFAWKLAKWLAHYMLCMKEEAARRDSVLSLHQPKREFPAEHYLRRSLLPVFLLRQRTSRRRVY